METFCTEKLQSLWGLSWWFRASLCFQSFRTFLHHALHEDVWPQNRPFLSDPDSPGKLTLNWCLGGLIGTWSSFDSCLTVFVIASNSISGGKHCCPFILDPLLCQMRSHERSMEFSAQWNKWFGIGAVILDAKEARINTSLVSCWHDVPNSWVGSVCFHGVCGLLLPWESYSWIPEGNNQKNINHTKPSHKLIPGKLRGYWTPSHEGGSTLSVHTSCDGDMSGLMEEAALRTAGSETRRTINSEETLILIFGGSTL